MLTVLAVGTVFGVQAQESGFGVRASMNLSTIYNKYDGRLDGGSRSDYEEDFKNRVGFNIGVIYDYGFTENFYIQPGLYFTTRGGKIDKPKDDYKEKWNLNYLQIPILASYRFVLTDNIKLHINAGPYVAVGLGGKMKYEIDGEKYDIKAFGTSKGEYDYDDDWEYYAAAYRYDDDYDDDYDEEESEKGGLKRFDAGLTFGAGVSINKFYIGLNYDLGLANIADKKQWADYKIKNRNFSIGVGYNF